VGDVGPALTEEHAVHAVQLADVHLDAMWSEADPALRSRSAYVTHWAAGSRSSAAVFFELEPGAHFGRHRHTAEETIIVMEGEVEVTVGDETVRLAGPAIAVAPALVRHDIRCVGPTGARCAGVWSSASVVSLWDDVLQPAGSRRAGTPIPTGM
jgi:quercetin dioxygenase-like cupin family protein